jgi:hypothetical protein
MDDSLRYIEESLRNDGNLKINSDRFPTLEIFYHKTEKKWQVIEIDFSWGLIGEYDTFEDAIGKVGSILWHRGKLR